MNDLLKQAEDYFRRGEYAQALQCYQDLLKENPSDDQLLHATAIVLVHLGRNREALKHINKAIKINPQDASYYNSKGNLLLREKKIVNAKKNYEQSLKLNPKYISACNNLGICYYRLNHFEQAEKIYLQALSLNPASIDAHYNYALTLLQLGKEQHAIDELQKTLELNPQHILALGQLADIYLTRNQFEKAIDFLKKRLEIKPMDAKAWHSYGQALLQLTRTEEAIQAFENTLSLQPRHPAAHHDLANAYLNAGDTAKALNHYLQQLEIEPQMESYYNIGVLLMNQERHKEALPYFEAARKLDPLYLPIYLNLGAIYLKSNQMPKAITAYQEAAKLKPEDKEIQHILSAITQQNVPEAAPKEYLQRLFDQYAHYYDKHLTAYLEYKVPEKLLQILQEACAIESPNFVVLDLGCGTGLSGQAFKPIAKYLIGIDISESMINTARKKNIYQELHAGDIQELISQYHNIDIILAADVFTYIGDLSKIFENIHHALKNNGLFIFTVEKTSGDSYVLLPTIRYAHSEIYLKKIIEKFHFKTLNFSNIILRKQHNKPVEGFAILLQKQ